LLLLLFGWKIKRGGGVKLLSEYYIPSLKFHLWIEKIPWNTYPEISPACAAPINKSSETRLEAFSIGFHCRNHY